MCLAVPVKIIEIDEEASIRMCKVNFNGVIQDVCIEAIPEAKIGDYIYVHAGFAINLLSEEEAQASLEAWAELAQAIEEEERKQAGL